MHAGANLSWESIKERAVYTIGPGSVCKCTGQCTPEGSVQGGGAKFFNLSLKLTNQRRPEVTCLVHR